MTQDQVFAVLIAQLEAALTGFGAVSVVNAYQPVTQGAIDGAAVYVSLITEHRYGQANTDYTPSPGGFSGSLTQDIELHVQLQASVPRFEATAPAPFKALDLLNAAVLYLDSDTAIAAMLGQGVSALRIDAIKTPYFENEAGQHEAVPTAELVLKYALTIQSPVPAIAGFEGGIKGY